MSEYKSLKDHVYNYITDKIQNGELSPGEKINEVDICEKLSISRTPAREALIQLSSENILEYIPRKGFLVKKTDTKKKLELYAIIGALDAMAAVCAMDKISEDDIFKMKEIVERIDISIKYENYHDYIKLQKKFHDIYMSRCENETLVDLINSLKNNIIRQSYLSDDKKKLFSVLAEGNRDHENVILCFQEKDKDRLEFILKDKHWHTYHIDMI